MVSIGALSPAEFNIAAAFLYYSAAPRLGLQGTAGIPFAAIVCILIPVFKHVEIVDVRLAGIVDGNIPLRSFSHIDVPFLDDLCIAVTEQVHRGGDITDFLGKG